ncbi:vWA domain-containing protein [Intestinibacter sp.]|uniref:vWA domain-containing protein n=1 Tax=Intestinibacter sp. TaxID=1965304 RepID=UPI003AB12F67
MKDRLTKLFTTFLAVVLLVGMSPAAASTAYAASWNSGTVASLNLGNKLSGFFDRLFGNSNKNDSNQGQTGQNEEKDSTEQGGNQLTATGSASSDPVTESDITLTKTAEDKGKDAEGNQLFDIKLGVQGTEKRTSKKVDIVLILDASSSMTSSLRTMTKNAAKTFVEKVFADNGVNAQVAVVSYGTTACARNYNSTRNPWTFYGSDFSSSNYSSNESAIKTAIDGAYSADNGEYRGSATNTEGAFLVAKQLASIKRNDAEHLTVFMTDGLPTRHYNNSGNIAGTGTYTSKDDYNDALAAAISLSEDSNIYNVALTGGIKNNSYQTKDECLTIAEKLMKQPPYKMTNDGAGRDQELTFSSTPSQSYAKAYYNITTTNENDASSQMEEIYRNIASQAISLVKDGVVRDVLPADFKLTEQGKKTLRDAGVTIIENADKTTTIEYTNVAAEKVATNLPTISVKYTGNGYGAAYTNSSATYSGKLYDGTENGKDFTKDFPKPIAGLHPKTVDDADSTSVGTTITVDVKGNDPFKQLTVDGYKVSDYTIVLTDKDGKEVSYTGDFTAKIDDNRQLQFTSSTAGTKELYYVVKANITQKDDKFATNGKTELVSRPTKVTIDVYGAANKAYVVDFGKPVTYTDTFTEAEKQATITLNGATNSVKAGTYGQMTLKGNGESITYKLTKFMDNIDVFTFDELYNNKVNVEKTVSMVPASSIYYEDNFADEGGKTLIQYGAGWELLGTDTISGVSGDGNLGYDSKYNTGTSELVYSGGTIHYVPKSTTSVKASFTFKGQGIDLYSYTSGATGKLAFRVYDGNTRVFNKTINTKYNSGEAYQVPVVTFMGEQSKTYRVEITVPKNEAFYLDALRIYNSVNVNKEQIGGVDVDNESSAKFVSIREQSLLSNNADLFTVDGDVFIDAYLKKNAKVVAIPKEMTEYTTYGRKTEVVIAPGDSITLTLKDAKAYSKVQLGARIDAAVPTDIIVPENLTNEVLVNNKNIEVKSSTDMYYTVTINNEGKLVITNNTNKLLALTKLKLVEK